MKLFIDECLSPDFANRLNETGRHEAIHPLHVGRRGEPDYLVLRRYIADDWTIVTQNGRDFRKLVAQEELYSGLIILPSINRERTWSAVLAALEYLGQRGEPADLLINHVLEVDASGAITFDSVFRLN